LPQARWRRRLYDQARPALLTPSIGRRSEEATRLAIESVENGWGEPFGAVIVKGGEIIGRGQNRVLLTGCPVHHAEITAIMAASETLNPKAQTGSEDDVGTTLQMIATAPDSPEPVP